MRRKTQRLEQWKPRVNGSKMERAALSKLHALCPESVRAAKRYCCFMTKMRCIQSFKKRKEKRVLQQIDSLKAVNT